MVKERYFKRKGLLKKYITKILYNWDDRKLFKKKYLKKLERNLSEL